VTAAEGDDRKQDSGEPIEPAPPARRPLQFSLAALLGVTTAVCILFSALRWLGVSARAGAAVLVILIAAAAAGLGLMFAIAQGEDDPPE
jgi:hypothetical protein